MTINFKQVAQASGITAFSNYTPAPTSRSYVLSPTTPVLVFDLGQGGSFPYVGLVNGSSAQLLYSSTAGLDNSNPSPLWFLNAILVGGAGSTSSGLAPWYGAYNISSNSFNYAINIQPLSGSPQSLQDVTLDFQNQVAYLFYRSSNVSNAIIYAISFSNLAGLVSNLQFPSSYSVAYFTAPNAPSVFSVEGGVLVYYNQTFYINTYDGSGNYYVFVVQYSSLTWSSTFPSSVQAVGSLYQYMTGGTTDVPNGEMFLNYIVSGSTITAELLIYAVTNYNSSNYYYGTVAIYSFNLSNNTATQLYSSTSANAKGTAVNMGGIIVFAQIVSGSSGAWNTAVGVFDRNLNIYEISQTFNSVQDTFVSQGGYAVVVSGSTSSLTFTVYQILLDTTPTIQNLSYNGGTLTGTVVDQTSGNPLANITVFLIQLASEGDDWAGGAVIASTTTNTSGGFSFSISQTGYYAVYAVP